MRNEGEVSDDDNIRLNGTSRNVEYSEKRNDSNQEIKKTDAFFDEITLDADADNGLSSESEIEIREKIVQYGQFSSGPIPSPEVFKLYPEYVQEKIIEWHDKEINATFTDTVRILEKSTEQENHRASRNQWLSFIIDVVIIIGGFVMFAITENVNVFWVYTLLGASIVGNVAITINSNKNNNKNKDE